MFSNIEGSYDKLPKDLDSATTKLFYCFSRLTKNGRNAKIANISHFSDFKIYITCQKELVTI